jgi:hypothetical protein
MEKSMAELGRRRGPAAGGAPAAGAPWPIRLSDPDSGRVLGAAFRIAPRLALTCWNVVAEHRDRGARVALTGPAGWSGTISPADLEEASPGADVALLRLPASVPDGGTAPMGPAEPPGPGSVLAAFGFPPAGPVPVQGRTSDQDDAGIWTRVVVERLDPGARRFWLASHAPDGMLMQHGFSGGPVVDPGTRLVVGMTTMAWARQPAALMIPVAALAACRAELRPILMPAHPGHPDVTRGGEPSRSPVSPAGG